MTFRAASRFRARRWADELRATTFTDARVVFAVVAAVGLVLFVAEARRWPKQRVPLADDQQRSWWLLRRSLEQYLGRAVTTGTGATGARARVRPRRRRLRVRLDADVARSAKPAVEQRAAMVLEQLIGSDRSEIRVRIRRREGKSGCSRGPRRPWDWLEWSSLSLWNGCMSLWISGRPVRLHF